MFKKGFTLKKLRFVRESGFTLRKLRFVRESGFTLIELLVVISIIGVLIGLSIFGLQGARSSSRDAKRKADLEQIRSGLEIYKTDCDRYPATLNLASAVQLRGDGTSTSSCLATNIYISATPTDPTATSARYVYRSTSNSTYSICAALENPPIPSMNVSGCGSSSSCGRTCNYIVTNP